MLLPDKPLLYKLPRIKDPRGNLSFIQTPEQLPFEIARCYWIYDVPGDDCRDGHAFYTSAEVIVALSGSFDVMTDTGSEAETFHLNRSYNALFVPAMCWRQFASFSTNSVGLVISSTLFDETDYIRDYGQFRRLVNLNSE